MKKIKPSLVIFDFDGVLADSERIYKEYWIRSSFDCGFELSIEEELKLRSADSRIASEIFGSRDLYDRVRIKRREYMKEYGKTQFFDLKPGVLDILAWLKEKGYTVVIASSSTGEMIKAHLEHYALSVYIKEVLSVKDIKRGKPYPDIYINICNHYHLDPSEVIAFEDAPNGVISASSAGVNTVMIPDLSEPDEELKQKTFAVIHHLFEIKDLLQ